MVVCVYASWLGLQHTRVVQDGDIFTGVEKRWVFINTSRRGGSGGVVTKFMLPYNYINAETPLRGGKETSMQIFLIISICFLYLVAGGLFSRGVWYFENNAWNNIIGGDASETGSGPGSYDIRKSVWHVNCCNPELGGGGGWGIFNALLGWTNSADYGSVISYNLYWICVMAGYTLMFYREKRGAIPVIDPVMHCYAG